MEVFSWLISSILIQNVILSRFLGTCPFLGVSKNKDNSFKMGLAVLSIIFFSSIISWLVNKYILTPLELSYMKTIVYILIIASFVQVLEIIIKRYSEGLYSGLGIYLPLITTNCAVLGVSTIVSNFKFHKMVVYSLGSGLGFLFVIYIFSSLREKINNDKIPLSVQGIPISLITAGIMAMIISRFSGV